MGQLEEKSRKRTRNDNLKAVVLGCVAVSGVLATGLLAPNVLGALGRLGMVPKARQDEYIHSARARLRKQGLLAERDGFLRVTEKGRKQLQSAALSLAKPRTLRRWDGKWRVLIFDIPEKRRSVRIRLREQLRAAGMKRIQDSVWIFPYPCEVFVALLKGELRIGKDMLYLIVDMMEGDAQFRTAFDLPVRGESLDLPPALDAILSTLLPRAR